MSRSPFLLIISAPLLAACSDNQCGPMGASEVGLLASSDQALITYGHLSGLLGNDCPDPTAPTGVVSLSITGTQTDGTGLITLCVPRPDLLEMGMRTFGTATSMADIRIVDATGTSNNCNLTLDSTRLPTGFATAKGTCGTGTDPAGFQLIANGAISLRRDCAGTVDTIAVTLRGTVAVAHRTM